MAAERDDYADFSPSVRRAFDAFGFDSRVRATQLAAELRILHPDHAAGLLEGASFGRLTTPGRTVQEWADAIRARYDIDVVARTRHQVLDARLTLLALAHLDRVVLADLIEAGALEQLRSEIAEQLVPDDADGVLMRHPKEVRAVAWSPDGTRLATAGADRTVYVLDATTGQAVTTLKDHTGWVRSIAWSPDGTRLATVGIDVAARVWDATTARPLTNLHGHTERVLFASWSPDGTRLATAGADGAARIWDTATGDLVTTLHGHTGTVHGVAWSRDSNRLATAGADSTARIWDPTTGETLVTLEGHTDRVRGVTWSPDGTLLATASADRTARIWDTTTSDLLTTLHGHAGTVRALAWSPDGTRLATASNDSTARIWEPTTGQSIATLRGHTGWVRGVAWSQDATRLATAGADRTVRIWTSPAEPSRWSPADHAKLVHDTPVEHDALNSGALAGIVGSQLRQFVQAEPGRAFFVHIDGSWGSGKTTLLRLIEHELVRKSGTWLSVRFDASPQSEAHEAWPALLTGLRRKVRSSRPGLRWTGLWWLRELPLRFGRTRLIASGLFLTLLALSLSLAIWFSFDSVVLGTAIATAGAVASLVGLGWSMSSRLARSFSWTDSSGSAAAVMNRQANAMEAMSRHFRWLVHVAEHPIVFAIDELDRRTSAYVVAVLDRVQTLVRTARGAASVVVIVAADGRWLRQSYEESHKEFIGAVATPGQELGHRFIDELFQLTVIVPKLSRARRAELLASALGASNSMAPGQPEAARERPTEALERALERSNTEEDVIRVFAQATPSQRIELAPIALQRVSSPQVQRHTESDVLKGYAALLPGEPRAIKRFVNNYGMLRATRTMEGSAVSIDHLVRWTVTRTRWPGLADHLRARPDDVVRIGSTGDLDAVPAMLRPLFIDADGQVRAVLGPLDPAAIRACTGTGDWVQPAGN